MFNREGDLCVPDLNMQFITSLSRSRLMKMKILIFDSFHLKIIFYRK